MRKFFQYAFVLSILLFLTLGLVRTVFFPVEINEYENRYANRIAAPTLTGFSDGTFQKSVEDALSDQVPLANYFKKAYNLFNSYGLKAIITPVMKLVPDHYIQVENVRLYNDFITYRTRVLSNMTQLLDEKMVNYNELFAKHPDLPIYAFYIEKDTDVDFETGAQVESGAYVMEHLALPAERKAIFTVDNFEQFSSWFYHTDHHWRAEGALEGYRQALALLKPEEAPLLPQGELEEIGTFSGSKANGKLAAFSETFRAYRYDYPQMTITINGKPAADYGNQDAFFAGQGGNLTYGNFYGGDDGEIIFETGTQGRGNILVVGESYDNAILKQLASHYDNTYSIDLRYYKARMGKVFNFTEYVQEHEIDTVLLIGNIDFYTSADFKMEG